MQFLHGAFQQVQVPTAWDEEGGPTAFEPCLHVNIPLGFTGDPRVPHYVEGSTLILPDGTPGPDLSAFMVAPVPTSPLAVFCGVETLFLRDTDTPTLAAALASWEVVQD